jgi:hypothetical protein
MKTALELLRIIYLQNGPRGKGGKVLPPRTYAHYSDERIDKHYDFLDRFLMRDIAKVLAKNGRWK